MKNQFSTEAEKIWPNLDHFSLLQIEKFYNLLLNENKTQNLTRIIDVDDFLTKNLLDTKILVNSGFLKYPALDLGSGAGLPGILLALVTHQNIVLVESEKRKADFLRNVVSHLQIKAIQVIHNRIENVICQSSAQTIISRAVGSIDKIYEWIKNGSTWNNLILFKGPKWGEEWDNFRRKREIRVQNTLYYGPPGQPPTKVLVNLVRE